MPTYAYACKHCEHRFDAVQSFTDAALTACPECGGTLRKQYGTVGVTFNGAGFYRTDSRAGTSKSDAKPDSSSGGGAATPTSSGAGTSVPSAAAGT